MQLTQYTDYALRVLIYVSLQKKQARVTVPEIAKHFQISRNHLIKVVHNLGTLGYLHTTRGKGGGICLQRTPDLINLGEVVRAMEVKLDPVDCITRPCPILPQCALRGILYKARDQFLQVLDGYTLADLVRKPTGLRKLLQFDDQCATR
jgi:Rrf2 family transcriptional regulator, nitric oxide-sensitive transcriptional repressor